MQRLIHFFGYLFLIGLFTIGCNQGADNPAGPDDNYAARAGGLGNPNNSQNPNAALRGDFKVLWGCNEDVEPCPPGTASLWIVTVNHRNESLEFVLDIPSEEALEEEGWLEEVQKALATSISDEWGLDLTDYTLRMLDLQDSEGVVNAGEVRWGVRVWSVQEGSFKTTPN